MTTLREYAVYVLLIATLALGAALTFPGQARGAEEPRDAVIAAGCIDRDASDEIIEVWYKSGNQAANESFYEHVEDGECFKFLNAYWVTIDRVVRKLSKLYLGEQTHQVKGHFSGSDPERQFYFIFYGDLPERLNPTKI